ncbi:uncharacterized protein CDAR_67461 [Caerostris darwini]|uniref:Uncharacterized protein n=1 Tax=Caerostris darwini TaxID=1538125 RepID=A0AAV4U8G4_9ARAC|nr:uncharacterized protein CDAR_67461 [Caerostris darwini]
MKFEIILVVLGFLITCFKSSDGQGATQQNPTKCDESIAENLCSKHKDKIKECAELMPEDEQQFVIECSKDMEISSSEDWMEIVDGICSQDNPAQTSFDMVSCWDEKRNSTLDQKCKRGVFMEAMKDMDCPCKTEKHVSCGTPGSEKAHAMAG